MSDTAQFPLSQSRCSRLLSIKWEYKHLFCFPYVVVWLLNSIFESAWILKWGVRSKESATKVFLRQLRVEKFILSWSQRRTK
jgi:hypothetical protein